MDFFIVTPSYNQRRFLSKTIESVLGQKGDFGLVYWVFDGGSNDGSKQLLHKFDKKLNWESKKDKGQTDAINKGVKELQKWLKQTGKNPEEVVFAYINSDDYYVPGAFSFVQKLFNRTTQRWLVSDNIIVNENGSEIQTFVRGYKQFWRFWLSKGLLCALNPIPQPGVFIRASEILKNGLFDVNLRYVMDYEYWLRLIEHSGHPLVTSKALAAFRIHSLSKGGNQYPAQFAEQYRVAQRFTKNPVILGLHALHNWLTVMAYRIVK